MELKEVFEPVLSFVKTFQKKEKEPASKQAAKDRLKLVLMQDRASVSPDFFDMMKKELIDVIKKYIEIDEESLEVELTRGMEVGLEGPALYANIPIKNVKPVAPQGDETEALLVDDITEERVDAAAEDILNHLEEIAQQNQEKMREQEESLPVEESLEESEKLEEGENLTSYEEEEAIQEISEEHLDDVPQTNSEEENKETNEEVKKVKKTSSKKTTSKKKKEE